jgi:hypothetical protein
MEEYRAIARQRYEAKKLEEAEKQVSMEPGSVTLSPEEVERIKQEQLELQARQELRQSQLAEAHHFIELWDVTIEHSVEIPELEYIRFQLSELVTFFQEEDRMNELQSRAVLLMEKVNESQSTKSSTAEEVRVLQQIMKDIFELSQVEIEIELMDTTMDEEIANRVQFELNQEVHMHQPVMPIIPPLMIDDQPPMMVDDNELPICSLHRRIGLTVLELRELARRYRISPQGTKPELCMRLMNARLVRLVE